jgi:hypothetical protein
VRLGHTYDPVGRRWRGAWGGRGLESLCSSLGEPVHAGIFLFIARRILLLQSAVTSAAPRFRLFGGSFLLVRIPVKWALFGTAAVIQHSVFSSPNKTLVNKVTVVMCEEMAVIIRCFQTLHHATVSCIELWAKSGNFSFLCVFLWLYLNFFNNTKRKCWSQWPRDLGHKLSSLARILGSWVRIPFKAWIFVLCAFILCLCCSVYM